MTADTIENVTDENTNTAPDNIISENSVETQDNVTDENTEITLTQYLKLLSYIQILNKAKELEKLNLDMELVKNLTDLPENYHTGDLLDRMDSKTKVGYFNIYKRTRIEVLSMNIAAILSTAHNKMKDFKPEYDKYLTDYKYISSEETFKKSEEEEEHITKTAVLYTAINTEFCYMFKFIQKYANDKNKGIFKEKIDKGNPASIWIEMTNEKQLIFFETFYEAIARYNKKHELPDLNVQGKAHKYTKEILRFIKQHKDIEPMIEQGIHKLPPKFKFYNTRQIKKTEQVLSPILFQLIKDDVDSIQDIFNEQVLKTFQDSVKLHFLGSFKTKGSSNTDTQNNALTSSSAENNEQQSSSSSNIGTQEEDILQNTAIATSTNPEPEQQQPEQTTPDALQNSALDTNININPEPEQQQPEQTTPDALQNSAPDTNININPEPEQPVNITPNTVQQQPGNNNVVKNKKNPFSLRNFVNSSVNSVLSYEPLIREAAKKIFTHSIAAAKIVTFSNVMTFLPALLIESANAIYTKFYKQDDLNIKDSIFKIISAGVSTLFAGLFIANISSIVLAVSAYVSLSFAFNSFGQFAYDKISDALEKKPHSPVTENHTNNLTRNDNILRSM